MVIVTFTTARFLRNISQDYKAPFSTISNLSSSPNILLSKSIRVSTFVTSIAIDRRRQMSSMLNYNPRGILSCLSDIEQQWFTLSRTMNILHLRISDNGQSLRVRSPLYLFAHCKFRPSQNGPKEAVPTLSEKTSNEKDIPVSFLLSLSTRYSKGISWLS